MLQEERFRNKVNWISFICAVFVVFLHAYSFNDGAKDSVAYYLEYVISRDMAQAAVPVFFALSAFLFYRNFQYSRLMAKFKSRFRSLVIPYLLWNFISMLIFFFITKLPFINTPPFELNLHTVFESLLFYRYNLVFWFVFNLILLTYLFPLLYPIIKSKVASCILFSILLYIYGWKFRQSGHFELRALIFYFVGAFMAVHYEKTVVSNQKVGILGVVSLILSQILVFCPWADFPIIYIMARLLMIPAVFTFSNLLCRWKMPAVLNCSFPIYAMHNIILEFFNKGFSFILDTDTNLVLIDYFGSTILTIVIIMIINRVLLKIMPGLHAVLFGGRAK